MSPAGGLEAIEVPQIDAMAAFMGALDDIAATAAAPDVEAGKEFAERVLGLFDTASTFYDADMAENLRLIDALATRLGEMACGGHDHAAETLNTVSNKYGKDSRDDHSDDHDHDGEQKTAHDAKKCESCKAGKPCSRK